MAASDESRLRQVFPGETEMARRMRAFDWSRTSLGDPLEWPPALRTAVSTALPCAFAIVIWWGPELRQFYNDEYIGILGAKHPWALGERGERIWHEIWDVIAPMLDQVMQRGEPTRSRDLYLPVARNGVREESYFSFSYSPILTGDGTVGGVFCPVLETTEKVIGTRRLHTLRDLASECTGVEDEAAVYRAAAKVLATNPHDIPFALLYQVSPSCTEARLTAATGISAGDPAAPVLVPLAPGDRDPWRLCESQATGMPVVHHDLAERFSGIPLTTWGVLPHAALVLPLLQAGQARPAAFLVAGTSPMRPLDQDYRAFLALAASQIASGLADARGKEAERRRAEALAELDRAKTVFFSDVSHEFRTPLTLMLGPLQDLLTELDGSLPPPAASTLRMVHRNGHRLLKLVNTLLDFSRIEAGRVQAQYEATDLAALTAELASAFRGPIERAGLTLVVDTPALPGPVYVDREMWEKIVFNLLSNAFKFTLEGEIRVRLGLGEGMAELQVADTGAGIAPEDQLKVFERFQRVRTTRARTHEGTGIGLALVHELVRLHGGQVSVSSRPGAGATFTVRIPLGEAHLPADRTAAMPALASTSTTAAPYLDEMLRWLPETGETGSIPEVEQRAPDLAVTGSRSTPSRILIADDNADMRDYLTRLLSRRHEVITASDGQAALDLIRRDPPDLVLTDVMMPGLDGFGLLQAVRTDERLRTLPIIMLSARAGEEARIEGLVAGADEYLTKPFSGRELVARVDSQLALASQRRQAEAALRNRSMQVETLLRGSPLGIYVVDADFRLRDVNPVAAPVFSTIGGSVVGRDFGEVMHLFWDPVRAEEIIETFRHTLETGESFATPEWAEIRRDSGRAEYYEWQVSRITLPDGRYGVVCYFRDISAQVTARHVIEQSQQALREADQRKDEFLATLAHELRNPLAPIRTGLEVLRSTGTGGTQAGRMLAIMERQVNHLVRLVDDLLEVSRITRGKLELQNERLLLDDVVQAAIDTSRPLLDASEHRLVLSPGDRPAWIEGDPVRLAQIFANLLNNAAKYSEPGTDVEVTVGVEGTQGVVRVRDTGFGIAEDLLPRVFDLFVQGAISRHQAQGGLGIGLTLVRRLVELHHGTVEAASEGAGRGSTFTVRLPLARAPESAPGRERRGSTRRHPRRLLIVDDNRDAAESLATLLRLRGMEVAVAGDWRGAIAAVEARRPDVVLLDLGLPEMDGFAIARRLRTTPGGKLLHLIALTGWGQSGDRQRTEAEGFDGHLVKPVDLETLEQLLYSLDATRRSHPQAVHPA